MHPLVFTALLDHERRSDNRVATLEQADDTGENQHQRRVRDENYRRRRKQIPAVAN